MKKITRTVTDRRSGPSGYGYMAVPSAAIEDRARKLPPIYGGEDEPLGRCCQCEDNDGR